MYCVLLVYNWLFNIHIKKLKVGLVSIQKRAIMRVYWSKSRKQINCFNNPHKNTFFDI